MIDRDIAQLSRLKEPTKGPSGRKSTKSRNPVRDAKEAEKKAAAAAAARGEQLGSGAAQTGQRNHAAGGYGMLWALGADSELFQEAKAKAQAKAAVWWYRLDWIGLWPLLPIIE